MSIFYTIVTVLPKPYIQQIGKSTGSFICEVICTHPSEVIKTTHMSLIYDGQPVGQPRGQPIQNGPNKVIQHFSFNGGNGTFTCRLTIKSGHKSGCNGITTQDSINSISFPPQPATPSQYSATMTTQSSTVSTPTKPLQTATRSQYSGANTESSTVPTLTNNPTPTSNSDKESSSANLPAIIVPLVAVAIIATILVWYMYWRQPCCKKNVTPAQVQGLPVQVTQEDTPVQATGKIPIEDSTAHHTFKPTLGWTTSTTDPTHKPVGPPPPSPPVARTSSSAPVGTALESTV